MKRHLWLIGFIIVVLGGIGFGYAGAVPSQPAWIVSTVLMVIGGGFLIASYLTYHQSK